MVESDGKDADKGRKEPMVERGLPEMEAAAMVQQQVEQEKNKGDGTFQGLYRARSHDHVH